MQGDGRTERHFRSLIQQFPLSVELYGPDGTWVDGNDAWEAFWQIKREDAVGFNLLDDPQAEEKGIGDYFRRAASGEVVQLPDHKFDPSEAIGSGRVRWLSSTFSPLRNEQGEVEFVVIVHKDITDRKELEEQIRQSQKMDAVGRLAGGFAHDLNNVLTPIYGIISLMLADRDVDDPDYEDIKQLDSSIDRAADLVRQILTFSHKVEAHFHPVSINESVNKAVSLLTHSIPKSIEIKLDLAEGLNLISADPTQIEQVLINLAVNAKDAMPKGGVLSLSSKLSPLSESLIRKLPNAKQQQYMVITISDTGTGIPADILSHIFEPFYTTKGTGKGTGLGLSMVYSIVKAHQGYIDCNSVVGKGTQFEIYLPYQESEAKAKTEKKTIVSGHGQTILVVDDEADIIAMCSRILGRFGYKVLTESDCVGALQTLRENKDNIDLVLLDFNMPCMSASECIKEIIALKPGMKVVVMSGYAPAKIVQEVQALGVKNILRKPFSVQALTTEVSKVF